MKYIFFVFPLILASCSPFLRGSGGSSSSRPLRSKTCLSKEKYVKTMKAISRCRKMKKLLPKLESDLKETRIENSRIKSSRMKIELDLKQCRKERDKPRKKGGKFWEGFGVGSGAAFVSALIIVLIIAL